MKTLNLIWALDLAKGLISGGASRIVWPKSILWRATWQGMNDLVELLLENGMQPDDQSSSYCPSPLYMAARLGHARIVDAFLAHGADHRGTSPTDDDTPLYAATMQGHVDTMERLVKQDPSQLHIPQPDRPLYAAAIWGSWLGVEASVKLGADPNLPKRTTSSDHDWTPLIGACCDGYVKTVEALLRNGADPNATGPKGIDKPLWFAAIQGKSATLS